jgi:hypothetical protein
METTTIVVLLVWIGFGIVSGVMASIKGRSFLIWMFLTLFLSPVWLFVSGARTPFLRFGSADAIFAA